MITREIRKGAQILFEKGIPYLSDTDFLEVLPQEGEIFQINFDERPLGYAYVGHSQKSDACVIGEAFSGGFFEKRVQQALEKRKKTFPQFPKAYRLIHSEADGIPGIHIEIFSAYAIITYFNHGIEHYQNELIAALKSILPHLKGVYAKDRTPTPKKPETTLIDGEPAPENLVVTEDGSQFIVRLNSGLMTGLFLDQRANRAWLKTISQGKSVCNTFSYTASLSIACALGGAKETTSVDISKTYSDWAKANFVLNGLDPNKNHIITNDAFDHFQFCQRKKIKYDMIILDPPTFAKKKKGTFSVKKNYEELIGQSIPLLNPQGVLVCSTNYTQWSEQDFLSLIEYTLRSLQNSYKVIHKARADKDFPVLVNYAESNHLKFIAVQMR